MRYYPPPTFGNDVWIGSNVVFIGSVNISDGAVVLSNAVVTKDVEPYQVVGGVPAKHIGYRFKKEDIELLLRLRWWDKPISWLEKNWNLLNDFDAFRSKVK